MESASKARFPDEGPGLLYLQAVGRQFAVNGVMEGGPLAGRDGTGYNKKLDIPSPVGKGIRPELGGFTIEMYGKSLQMYNKGGILCAV